MLRVGSRDFSGFPNDSQTITGLAGAPYGSHLRASPYARSEQLDHNLAPFEAHPGFGLTPLPPANPPAATASGAAITVMPTPIWWPGLPRPILPASAMALTQN
ncbi:MAG: hypothetical protein WCS20_14450, partial [Alphaproteobacteria bacterium]